MTVSTAIALTFSIVVFSILYMFLFICSRKGNQGAAVMCIVFLCYSDFGVDTIFRPFRKLQLSLICVMSGNFFLFYQQKWFYHIQV